MKTSIRLLGVLGVVLVLFCPAWASTPPNGTFTLRIPLLYVTIDRIIAIGPTGLDIFENPDLSTAYQVQRDCLGGKYSVVSAQGYRAVGTVINSSGVLEGLAGAPFSYTENAIAFCASSRAINHGKLIISSDSGRILIYFWGEATISGIVENQPFVVLGGTQDYHGLRGSGLRNTLEPPGPLFSEVQYEGQFLWPSH